MLLCGLVVCSHPAAFSFSAGAATSNLLLLLLYKQFISLSLLTLFYPASAT